VPQTHPDGRSSDLRNPVEQVTWDDCERWLGRVGLVLPTEAQWEYAARGGTTTPRWFGIGTDGIGTAANIGGIASKDSGSDSFDMTAPVGSLRPNPFGLHDVLGNVWEWCRDLDALYEVPVDPGDGLRRPSASRFHVVRGGAFNSDAQSVRSAARFNFEPRYQNSSVGVRPARLLVRP
jgi:formylglycine-generating enzyme required for sulfatase activity